MSVTPPPLLRPRECLATRQVALGRVSPFTRSLLPAELQTGQHSQTAARLYFKHAREALALIGRRPCPERLGCDPGQASDIGSDHQTVECADRPWDNGFAQDLWLERQTRADVLDAKRVSRRVPLHDRPNFGRSASGTVTRVLPSP
jgi:hypothetical protein